MNKELLIELISTGYSISEISKNTGNSKTSIRYWLKKFSLKTKHPNRKNREFYSLKKEKLCPKCNKTKKKNEFYKRKNRSDFSSYCKQCTNLHTLEKQREFKVKCVEYKGGKCEDCGYNKCVAAFDFHHLDPGQKDFTIGSHKFHKLSEKIKKELDKCILLCSNCHRERHFILK